MDENTVFEIFYTDNYAINSNPLILISKPNRIYSEKLNTTVQIRTILSEAIIRCQVKVRGQEVK